MLWVGSSIIKQRLSCQFLWGYPKNLEFQGAFFQMREVYGIQEIRHLSSVMLRTSLFTTQFSAITKPYALASEAVLIGVPHLVLLVLVWQKRSYVKNMLI